MKMQCQDKDADTSCRIAFMLAVLASCFPYSIPNLWAFLEVLSTRILALMSQDTVHLTLFAAHSCTTDFKRFHCDDSFQGMQCCGNKVRCPVRRL